MRKKIKKVNSKRVNIFGSPGAGKTRLAKSLGKLLGVNTVYHLDEYFWKPGWEKTTLQERISILERLQSKNEWIIEGNFSNITEIRAKKADLNIHLSTNRVICLLRVLFRYIAQLGRNKIEIAPGCPDKISFKYLRSIWNYPISEGKQALNIIRREGFLIILNNEKEVLEFLSELKSSDEIHSSR